MNRESAQSARLMLLEAIAACPIELLASTIRDGLRARTDAPDAVFIQISNDTGRIPRERLWEWRNGCGDNGHV